MYIKVGVLVILIWVTLVNGATVGQTDFTEDVTDVMTTDISVTQAECRDKLENCFYYGDGQCLGRYEPWARDNCAYRCGYCPGNYPPCEDKITYCSQLGSDACTASIYSGFVRLNCRKTCNKCTIPGLNSTLYISKNTTELHPTDLVPIKQSAHHPTVGQTGNTTECKDKKDNCFNYDDYKCLGIYEPWARDNCAYRCGYCPEKPPCINRISTCEEYGENLCTEKTFSGWVRLNCRKYCNKCEVPYKGNDTETQGPDQQKSTTVKSQSTDHVTPPYAHTGEPVRQTTILFPVLPTGDACRDIRNDCANYNDEACNGVFKSWAMSNCPRRCGFCTDEQTPCMDYEDCGHLPQTLCTAEEFRDVATTSCRKFCGLCSDVISSTRHPTQATKMPTSKVSTHPSQRSTVKSTFQPQSSSTMPERTEITRASTLKQASSSTMQSPVSYKPSNPVTDVNLTSPKAVKSTILPTPPKPGTTIPTPPKPTKTSVQLMVSTMQPTETMKTPTATPSKQTDSYERISSKGTDATTMQAPSKVTDGVTMKPSPKATPLTEPVATTRLPESSRKTSDMRTPPKTVVTSGILTPKPATSAVQPTPSPLNPDLTKGQPTPSPTIPTFNPSSTGPDVCNTNFVEPVPKCCRVCACPGEEVFGRVTNQNGEPLANAQISFSGCDCVRHLSDPSGNYAIQNICVGGHELFYERAGYMPSKMLPVQVVKGGKFWRADNVLITKPTIPTFNVTGTPAR